MPLTHEIKFAKESICYFLPTTIQVCLRFSRSGDPFKKNCCSSKKIREKSFQSLNNFEHRCTPSHEQSLRRIPHSRFKLFQHCWIRVVSKPLLSVRNYKNGSKTTTAPLYPTKYKCIPKPSSVPKNDEAIKPVRGLSQVKIKKEMRKLAFKIKKDQQMMKKSIDSTEEAPENVLPSTTPTTTIKSRDFDCGVDLKEKQKIQTKKYNEKLVESKHIKNLKNLINKVKQDVTDYSTNIPSILIASTSNSNPTSSKNEESNCPILLPSPLLYISQDIKSKPLMATYLYPSTVKQKEKDFTFKPLKSSSSSTVNNTDMIQSPSPKLYVEKDNYNPAIVKRIIDYMITHKPSTVNLFETNSQPTKPIKNVSVKEKETKITSPPSPVLNDDFIKKSFKGANNNLSLWDFSNLERKVINVKPEKRNQKFRDFSDTISREKTNKLILSNESSSTSTSPSKIKDLKTNEIFESRFKITEKSKHDTTISLSLDVTEQSKKQSQPVAASKRELKSLSNITDIKTEVDLNLIDNPFKGSIFQDSNAFENKFREEDAAFSKPIDDYRDKKNIESVISPKENECKEIFKVTVGAMTLKDVPNSMCGNLSGQSSKNALTKNTNEVESNLTESKSLNNFLPVREIHLSAPISVPRKLDGSINSEPEVGLDHNKSFLKRVFSQNPNISENKAKQIEKLSFENVSSEQAKPGAETGSDYISKQQNELNDIKSLNNNLESSKNKNENTSMRFKKLMNLTHPMISKRLSLSDILSSKRRIKRNRHARQSCQKTSNENLENNTKDGIHSQLYDNGKCKSFVKKTLTCEMTAQNNEIFISSEITKSENECSIGHIIASESKNCLDRIKQNVDKRLKEIATNQQPLKSKVECTKDNQNFTPSFSSNVTSSNTKRRVASGKRLRNTSKFRARGNMNFQSILNTAGKGYVFMHGCSDDVVNALSTDCGSNDYNDESVWSSITSMDAKNSSHPSRSIYERLNQISSSEKRSNDSSSRKKALTLIPLMHYQNMNDPCCTVTKPERNHCEPPIRLYCKNTTKKAVKSVNKCKQPCVCCPSPNFGITSIDDYISKIKSSQNENINVEINKNQACFQENQKDESNSQKKEESSIKTKEVKAMANKLLNSHILDGKIAVVRDNAIDKLIKPLSPTSPRRLKRRLIILPKLSSATSQALSDRLELAQLPNKEVIAVDKLKTTIVDQTSIKRSTSEAILDEQPQCDTGNKASRKRKDRKRKKLQYFIRRSNSRTFHSAPVKLKPNLNVNNYKHHQTGEPINEDLPSNTLSEVDGYKSNIRNHLYNTDNVNSESHPNTESRKPLVNKINYIQAADDRIKRNSSSEISKRFVLLVNKAVTSVSDSLSGILQRKEDTRNTKASDFCNMKFSEGGSQTKAKPTVSATFSPSEPANDLKISTAESSKIESSNASNQMNSETVHLISNDVSIRSALKLCSPAINLDTVTNTSNDTLKSSKLEFVRFPAKIPKFDETPMEFKVLEKRQKAAPTNLDKRLITGSSSPSGDRFATDTQNSEIASIISKIDQPTTHLDPGQKLNFENSPGTNISIPLKLSPLKTATTNLNTAPSVTDILITAQMKEKHLPLELDDSNDHKMPIAISKAGPVSNAKELNYLISPVDNIPTTTTGKKDACRETRSNFESEPLNKKSSDMKKVVVNCYTKKENPYKSFADLFPT